MTMTYERLRDDAELRAEFNSTLNLAEKREVFSQLSSPDDGTEWSDEDLQGIQKSIMMKTSEPDEQVPLQPGTQTVNDIPMSWGEVGSEALRNLDDSAIEYGKNLWQAMRHPIETGQQLYGLMAGAVEKAIPGGEDKHAEILENTVDFFKERYGGTNFGEVVNSIKTTMAKDPVGFLSDLSVVVTGGGGGAVKAVQLAGKTAKIAGAGAKAGGVVNTANKIQGMLQKAQVLDPASVAFSSTVKGASKAIKGFVTKEKIHRGISDPVQQALKMKGDLERNDFLSTAFTERGFDITEADMKAMGRNRQKLGAELENAAKKATQENAQMYHRDEFVQVYDDMLKNMSKEKLEGTRRGAYRSEIENLRESFIKEYPEQMTVKDLHDMRSGIEFIKGADQEFGKVANKINAKKRAMISTIMTDVFPEIAGEAKKYKKKFTKKGKKDVAPSPSVEGDISTAGYQGIADELGIHKELEIYMQEALNKERAVGRSGSKGIIVGGAANVAVGIGAGLATGSPMVGAGSALGYVVAAHYLSKVIENPRVRIGVAHRIGKAKNIRLSVAKKLIDERVQKYLKDLGMAGQQAGRVANVQEQAKGGVTSIPE